MPKIRIERKSEWNNKARIIEIYINNEFSGAINDGETQDYYVEHGKHEIYAKIDWCRSNKIELDTAESEITALKLTGYKYGTWIFPVIFGIMLVYFLGKYALNLDLNFLIWFIAITYLYPLYYITFNKNRYLVITAKDKKNNSNSMLR